MAAGFQTRGDKRFPTPIYQSERLNLVNGESSVFQTDL